MIRGRALASLSLLILAAGCGSGISNQEPPPGTLANGSSAFFDDGRCPPGQVSKVTAPTSLTGTRTYACVPRARTGGIL